MELSAEGWANLLVTLEAWGWEPRPGDRMRLLAPSAKVSTETAEQMATAAKSLLSTGLKAPLSVYPIRADMGDVKLVADFCEGGPFTID